MFRSIPMIEPFFQYGCSAQAAVEGPSFLSQTQPGGDVFLSSGPVHVLERERRADESFQHALLTGRNPFHAAREALLGRTTTCHIDDDHESRPADSNHSGIVSLAQDCQAKGEYERAIQNYRRALAVPHPDNPMVRFLYATAIVRDGRCRENAATALKELTTAQRENFELCPSLDSKLSLQSCLIQYEKATVLSWLGRNRTASLHYTRALNLLRLLVDFSEKYAREMTASVARAGIWIYALYAEAGYEDFIHEVMTEEVRRCLAADNFRGAAKIYFERALFAHQKGSFKEARGLYGIALDCLQLAGDESLPEDGPVEQTNWSPFLRLLIALCKASLAVFDSPQRVAAQIARKGAADVARILGSRPKALNLRQARKCLFGLAQCLEQLGFNRPAAIHHEFATIMEVHRTDRKPPKRR